MEPEYQTIGEGNVIEIHLPDDFMEATGGSWQLNEDGTAEEIHVVLMAEPSETDNRLSSEEGTVQDVETLFLPEGSGLKELVSQGNSQDTISDNQNVLFVTTTDNGDILHISEKPDQTKTAEETTGSVTQITPAESKDTSNDTPKGVETSKLGVKEDGQSDTDAVVTREVKKEVAKQEQPRLQAQIMQELTATSKLPIKKASRLTPSFQKLPVKMPPPKQKLDAFLSYKKSVANSLQVTAPGRYRPSLPEKVKPRGPPKYPNRFLKEFRAKRTFGSPIPVRQIPLESASKRPKLLLESDSDSSSDGKYDGKAYIRVKGDTNDVYIDYIPESVSKTFSDLEEDISSVAYCRKRPKKFDRLLDNVEWVSLTDSQDGLSEIEAPLSPMFLKELSVVLKPMPRAVVRSAIQGYLRISPLSHGRFLLEGIGSSSSSEEESDLGEENETNDASCFSDTNDSGCLLNKDPVGSVEDNADISSKNNSDKKEEIPEAEQADKTWSAARAKLEALMTESPQDDEIEEAAVTALEIVECASTGETALATTTTSDTLAPIESKEDMATIYNVNSAGDATERAPVASITSNQSSNENGEEAPKETALSSSLLIENMDLPVSTPIPASVSLASDITDDDLNSSKPFSFMSDDEKPDKKLGRKHAQDLPVKCPLCVKTYVATKEELEIHLRFHEEGCKTLKCPICARVEIAWYHMARHARRHPELQADINKLNIGDRYKKSCPECNRKYATKAGLMRHFEMYHGSHLELFQCQECHRFFKDMNALSRHMDSHRDVDYWCKECDFTTKVKKDFLIHRRTHGAEVFFCSECQHSFTKQSALKHHLAIKHKIREPVLCEECGCCYSSQTGLQIHIQRMHKQDQKHPCPYCPYIGTMRSNLYQHIDRTHVKPFRCDQCDYATKAADTLQRHIAAFHDQSRTHTCPHCRYRAQTVRHLTEHLRLQHNPNVLRYPCDYCHMKFKTLTMLRDHLPSHTGQLLYTCKICNFRCKYRPNMHRHMKKRHPGQPLKDNIQGPRQDLRFATRKRNEVQDPGSAPEVIISSMEHATEISPEVTIMTDDTLYTVEETINAINTLDGVQLSTGEIATITTQPGGLTVNGEEMIEVTEATAENLISSLLTVDPETGAVFLNDKAVRVDGNVAFQIVQEEDGEASGIGDQAHKAVELLLLAMDPSASGAQTEAVEVPVIDVSSEGQKFVSEETKEAVDSLMSTEPAVVPMSTE